jgi:hypothetical protein
MLQQENRNTETAGGSSRDARDYRVNIGWRQLTYSEDEHSAEPIKIYIDPPARYGQPFSFYIPGETRWREVMPNWAVDRHQEIVARIKEECSHYHAEWIEG